MRVFAFSAIFPLLAVLFACGEIDLGSDQEPQPNTCAGKTCGADCTAPGSKEPFSCNSAGACVEAIEALSCDGVTDAGGPCTDEPTCDPGHTEIESSSDCLQDDAVCYEREACGVSIWCTGPAAAATPNPTSCVGKVCGADCTPAASDEPFNCNAAGQCVVTGTPLGCDDDAIDAGSP